jgi:hypothetical protein
MLHTHIATAAPSIAHMPSSPRCCFGRSEESDGTGTKRAASQPSEDAAEAAELGAAPRHASASASAGAGSRGDSARQSTACSVPACPCCEAVAVAWDRSMQPAMHAASWCTVGASSRMDGGSGTPYVNSSMAWSWMSAAESSPASSSGVCGPTRSCHSPLTATSTWGVYASMQCATKAVAPKGLAFLMGVLRHLPLHRRAPLGGGQRG